MEWQCRKSWGELEHAEVLALPSLLPCRIILHSPPTLQSVTTTLPHQIPAADIETSLYNYTAATSPLTKGISAVRNLFKKK